MDPNRLAEIFSDQRQLERIAEAIFKIEQSVSSLARVTEGASRTVRDGVESVEKGVEGVKKQVDNVERDISDLVDISELATSSIDNAFQKLSNISQRLGLDKVIKDLGDIEKLAGNIGKSMASMQREGGVESAAKEALKSIPMGGFLMMALQSSMRQDIFDTAGRSTALKFEQNGASSADTIRSRGAQLGHRSMMLDEANYAEAGELNKSFGTLADKGIKIDDAFAKATVTVKGFGYTIGETALGLDKAFQAAAGTSAALASQLTQETNKSLDESLSLVREMGLAAHATGRSFESFAGIMTQVTGALRVQGGSLHDIEAAYMNIQKGFNGMFGNDPKMKYRADNLTAGAVSGLGAMVTGADVGMQAHIAEAVGKRLGIDTSGMSDVDLVNNMRTGFQREGGASNEDFMKSSIIEQWNAIDGTSAEREFYFREQRGVPPELAMALRMAQDSGGNLFDDTDLNKAIGASAQQLQEDPKSPLSMGKFEEVMKDVMNVMNAVGEVIGSLLTGILRVLMATAEVGYKTLHGNMSFDEGAERLGNTIGEVFSGVNKAGLHAGETIRKTGVSGLGFLSTSGLITTDASGEQTSLANTDSEASINGEEKYLRGAGQTFMKLHHLSKKQMSSYQSLVRKHGARKAGYAFASSDADDNFDYQDADKYTKTIDAADEKYHVTIVKEKKQGGRMEPHSTTPEAPR